MQEEKYQLSKTPTWTCAMWATSAGLFITGACMEHERLMLIFFVASILTCGLAVAWTVRCFMQQFANMLENAYLIGQDKGRMDSDVPLQRVQ